ncbi:MAG: hypothetical protein BroJett040_20980 [Oligoflexia bacterium]|nr:MAG: hypothetical protein BroJett040_20980 [Oligoflexia bacterium]
MANVQNADGQLSQIKYSPSSGEFNLEILDFQGPAEVLERLQEMGLHCGSRVKLVGQAPFGGPLLFRFGTTVIALRQDEAQCILYKRIS